MILSGTTIGFLCVGVLLVTSVFLALFHRTLARLAIALFLIAFVGGVAMTLTGAIRGREANRPTSSNRVMPGGSIGKVDPGELSQLETSVRKDPKDVRSRERLGHLYLQLQDFEKVFEVSHGALQLNPGSVESRVHIGMVLFAMNERDSALEQFDRALQADPKNLEALLYKGIVQYQGDDLMGAKKTWEIFMKNSRPGDRGRERVEMFLGNLLNP